jgi:hypothetical protein
MNTAVLTFKQSAIKGLAALLTDKGTFARVLQAVQTVDDPTTPGNEKRAAVIKQLEIIGLDLAKWLIALLIELAVSYLRLAAEQQLNK